MDNRGEGAAESAMPLRGELGRALADYEHAVGRFRSLRRRAFAGDYDSDAFDRAVLAVRAAAARVRAARRRGTEAGPSEPPRPSHPDRASLPARLRFVRWLVETGRLSEQLAGPRAATDHG